MLPLLLVLLVLGAGVGAWALLAGADDGEGNGQGDEVRPTTTTPPLAVTSIEASEFTCPGTLVLTWTTEGATSVEVAIDAADAVDQTGPANGTTELPAPCDGDSWTYHVTAVAADGDRTTQELRLESP